MVDDFSEWLDEKLRDDWSGESEDYLRDWLRNNVNDDEWNPDELTGDERNEAFDEFAANVDADPSSDYYTQAFDEWREENQDNYDESDWLDAEDLDLMSGVENAYEITWPYWTSINSGEIDADQVADEFSRAVGREVRVNTRYHQSGARPDPNNQFYVVEPDGSLEGDNDGDEGLEFVSPPMPIDELLKDLNAVKVWAGRMGVYTNQSTGLHINISVPEYSKDRLDFVKLALLLGDEYVLDLFGRASNTYARSALGKVRDRVRQRPEEAKQLLDKMKGQMGELASKAIHGGYTDKYTSINTKDGHIEFRSPGGDWLDDNFDKIENTLLRFTVAMSAALNPEAYREEYQKKLYKLLTQDQKDSDTIRYFADYVAGKIPRAALRSFVKQAQLQRKEKRGEKSGEKMWWRVSNPGNSYASVEVVATSREEAIEKALGEDGYPSWANTRQSVVAEPVRPYEEQPAQQAEPQTASQSGRPNDPNGRYAIVPRSDPAAYGQSRSGTPDYQFRFNMSDPAAQAQGRYVLQAWAARNNLVAADYMVVDTEQWDRPADADQTDVNPLRPTGPGPWELASRSNNQVYFNPQQTNRAAAETEARLWLSLTGYNPSDFVVRTREGSRSDAEQSGIIDIEPDIEVIYPGSTTDLAQQRATPGTFSGAWKVLVNGEEVYRFSGVGNNQSDANRVAAQWLRNNGRGVSGEGFEVYPIMTEGVAENFADGENPVKFTVSSPDGYQHSFQITLAVHGKHVGHFNFVRSADTDDVNNEAEVEQRWQGQGYGKLLLMKAIDVANNHGLDFQQDIRGITDAQQNVYDSLENAGLIITPGDGFWFLTPQGEQELNGLNENFADGKNPGRKGLSKRVGVNTKASVSSLRKTAKNSSGEKQRMAHWLANMKAGRAKAKRK
jgi:GNAT superfamily N-acetyltransferase